MPCLRDSVIIFSTSSVAASKDLHMNILWCNDHSLTERKLEYAARVGCNAMKLCIFQMVAYRMSHSLRDRNQEGRSQWRILCRGAAPGETFSSQGVWLVARGNRTTARPVHLRLCAV